MNKFCSKCGMEKLVTMFSPDRRAPCGLTSWCKSCIAAAAKIRRLNNPQAHRESVKKSTQKHYEKKLERNRIYRKNNPEKVKQWKLKDRKKNKVRILADNAKRRSLTKTPLTPDIKMIYALRDFMQAMSLGEIFHVDHIIPVSKNGPHTPENLQVIPAICNLRKGASI
jgi:5-methylcytosine-specific restriction endonuclease McrA